ncbi:MAG: 3-hydroxyacyl-CoA dehydrogenase NAD-binding domain-containing protein [Bryobacteraceae bacterium]
MAELVQLTRQSGVGVITIENPPVNALSPGVPEAIAACVEQVEADPDLVAAVVIGGGRTFIAGADIREFVKITSGEKGSIALNPVLERVEASRKPVVAAIHGTALGGGLEVAMACHYRVAVPSAQLGQPEVKLGLIPGAGGTVRLPRLIGPAKAAEMCALGEPIRAAEAHSLGLVDRLIDGDLLAGAIDFAREVAPTHPRRTCDSSEKLREFDRPRLPSKLKGRLAPQAAIRCVENAVIKPFDEALAEERRTFEELLHSDESKALVHVFFGEREVGKVPGVPAVKDVGFRKVAVIGAGTMGGGIAMAYANAGFDVLLIETAQEALDRGVETIRRNYASTVSKGRLSRGDADARIARIRPVVDAELTDPAIAEAGLIVEAVFENMELKKQVFAALDRVAAPDAVLATNTSTLSIDEIAAATSRPGRVVGHHFFSPANVMRLLEIVRGAATEPEVLGVSLALAKKLGKIGVVAGNCRGFIGNRMFHPYRREAQFLVEEGASIFDVDQTLVDFGMAMGPLAVGDLAGLDVGWRIRKEYAHLEDPSHRHALIEDRLCEMGRFGQKTSRGWYLYDENRTGRVDPEVAALAERLAHEAGIPRRKITRDEILDRCLFALANEGCRILEEGIALRPVDIDIVYIHGYGFPAHKGGPMKYAESIGWRKVYDRVCEFEQEHGEAMWAPAAKLRELAGV